MIERTCTVLETLALGLWAGAMAGFAFVFAPAAFRSVQRMDVFATIVADSIRGVASLGVLCATLALGAAALRAREPGARRLAAARIALVLVALGASRYETASIIPRMAATAATIPGPLDSVPKSDARRAAYDRLHDRSSRVYGTALLCVLAAAALAAFGRSRPA